MFQFNNLTIKQFSNKGMTLIELLVVLALIFIMTGAIVVNPGKSKVNLDNASRQLITDLRRAQNMSMSAVEQGSTVPCGYGIYRSSSTSYVLFYNSLPNCSTDTHDHTGSTDFETVDLTKTGTTLSSGTVYFITPTGTTYINGTAGGTTIQTFTFTAGSATKTVTISPAGKIE